MMNDFHVDFLERHISGKQTVNWKLYGNLCDLGKLEEKPLPD